MKCSVGNWLLCLGQQNKLAAPGEKRTHWNVWLGSPQARSAAHLQKSRFQASLHDLSELLLVFSSFLPCERNRFGRYWAWIISVGLSLQRANGNSEWQFEFADVKQVFHCEKEELVASSPRAAQGAFLSPLLGWKMATDVRYCEILKMLTLKGLWKA